MTQNAEQSNYSELLGRIERLTTAIERMANSNMAVIQSNMALIQAMAEMDQADDTPIVEYLDGSSLSG